MPKVKGEVAGSVLTLLGYDGTDFYNVLVDAAGRLQIDVVGSGLPAGAATSANQVLLLAELGEKLQTDDLLLDGDGRLVNIPQAWDGSAYAHLLSNDSVLRVDIHAEVAGVPYPLLADLAGHLHVDVETSGLPTGAATAAWQDSINDGILTVAEIRNALQTVHTDRLKVRGEDQFFSIKDVYSEVEIENDVGIGTGTLTFTKVPEGEFWVITNYVGFSTSSDPSKVLLCAFIGGLHQTLVSEEYPEANLTVGGTYHLVLKKDDYLYAYFYDCIATTDIRAQACGYKMTKEA